MMVTRSQTRSSHGTGPHNHRPHRTALPPSIPLSIRLSMEDYYERRGAGTSLDLDLPPSYDAFLLQPLHARKYNIQPREDEGREVLPAYSCAISLEAVFMRKTELEGAVHRAQDRNWYKVFATLQGTALSFYKCKGGGPFQIPGSGGGDADMPTGAKRGVLMKSYNLQHAEVGVAADYYKKRYVIRVRAEADQFLLSCLKLETFVLWLQSLFAAIDLAPPLDDRQIPRDLSIPRPRRRRQARATTNINMERNAALVAEQQEIMRTQFPRLALGVVSERSGDEVVDEEDDDGEGSSNEEADIPCEDSAPIPSASRSPVPSPSRTPTPSIRSPPSMSSYPHAARPTPIATHSSSNSHSNNNNTTTILVPTIRLARRPRNTRLDDPPDTHPETGKWQPTHAWTPNYDIQYARRCMAVLTNHSPRKSNFLIMKGKQWIVDWATGVLTRWEPPDYGEAVAGMENFESGNGELARLGGNGGRLRINARGELIVV